MNKNCIASANIEVYNWWQQSQIPILKQSMYWRVFMSLINHKNKHTMRVSLKK
jgi:hypothetical protein